MGGGTPSRLSKYAGGYAVMGAGGGGTGVTMWFGKSLGGYVVQGMPPRVHRQKVRKA